MNIPGLLIEYLITGGIACLWLLPCLQRLGFFETLNLLESKAVIPLIGIPFLYTIGLLIDSIIAKLLHRRRNSLREEVQQEFYKSFKDSTFIKGKISAASLEIKHLSQDLGKEYEARSSRDRIARGTILNLIFSAFVLPFLSKSSLLSFYDILTFFAFLGLSYVFYGIWKMCEKDSHRYKLYALYLLSRPTEPSNNESTSF